MNFILREALFQDTVMARELIHHFLNGIFFSEFNIWFWLVDRLVGTIKRAKRENSSRSTKTLLQDLTTFFKILGDLSYHNCPRAKARQTL